MNNQDLSLTPLSTKQLLLVFHSMTQGTQQMVQACASAATTQTNIEVVVKHASQTLAQDLQRANGYVFATPEYLGSMSGMLKDCFDRTYYPLLDQIQGRPYAIMVCAGSDGHSAVKQIERIVTGWRLKPMHPAIIVNVAAQEPQSITALKHLTDEQLQPCKDLGALFAAGLAMSIF
jgi:NAD(P)H-dependent FMN reductase